MCFCDNCTCKKITAKNFKVAYFWPHIVCIGVVFRKLNRAKLKISLNHLKFCTWCFCGICKLKKKLAESLKVTVSVSTLMHITVSSVACTCFKINDYKKYFILKLLLMTVSYYTHLDLLLYSVRI